MAMSPAERRRKERERKARQRAAARADGKPTTALVHAAIIEALVFECDSVNTGDVAAEGTVLIDMTKVVQVAHRIMRRRHGVSKPHSIAAISKTFAPRPEHHWPSHYPTHSISPPDAGSPASHGGSAQQDVSASQS